MARIAQLAEALTLAQLKSLVKTKEEMTKLTARRDSVAKELAALDARLAKLRSSLGLKTAKRRGRPTASSVRKVRKGKAVAKPAGGRKTLAQVVADVIRKKGRPLGFQDLHDAIVMGKLIKSKSKNFANVLRRTLSTSPELIRVARGIYGIKGITAKAAAGRKTTKKKVKKIAKKKTSKKKTPKKKTVAKAKTRKTVRKTIKKRAAKTSKKKVVKKTARAASAKRSVKKSAPTIESVVVDLLAKAGKPMSFKDLLARIEKGKLVRSKSKNFANVLRRTLSTSKNVKRVGRGIYTRA